MGQMHGGLWESQRGLWSRGKKDKEAGSLNTTGFMGGSVQRAVWTCTNVSGLRRESGWSPLEEVTSQVSQKV